MRKRQMVWRVVRYVIAVLLLAFVTVKISTLVACGKLRIKDGSVVILPPAREGKDNDKIDFSLLVEHGFESAYAEADFVAHVRVGNWLSEKREGMLTCYEATVIHTYKGDMTGDFTLVQKGSSKYTLPYYPLFTYGNEILAFCKKSEKRKNEYYIVGSFATVLDVATTNGGEVYFMDRSGLLGEKTENLVHYIKAKSGEVYYIDCNGLPSDSTGKLINYTSQIDLMVELKKYVRERDLVLSKYQYPYVFSASDIEALIAEGVLK